MGSCSSVTCANGEIEKVRKIEIPKKTEQRRKIEKTEAMSKKPRKIEKTGTSEKSSKIMKAGRTKRTRKIKKTERRERREEIKKNEEIEETPVIEIHIGCPSSTASWHFQSEFKQAVGAKAKVCSSLDVIDIEDADELLTEEQQFLSGNNSDDAHPQVEYLKLGAWPDKNRGFAKQNDVQDGERAEVEQRSSSSFNNETQLQRQAYNDRKSSNLTSDLAGSSVIHRKTKFSAPLPSPSQWLQVYVKKLKHKEKHAEKSLKKEPKKKPKKQLSREEQDYAYKISFIKKIKKSIKKNAKSHGANAAPDLVATDEYFARIFGVNVEDLKASSSSSSSASSRSSSAVSQQSLNDLSIGRFYKGEESNKDQSRQTRKWFQWKQNRVVPL